MSAQVRVALLRSFLGVASAGLAAGVPILANFDEWYWVLAAAGVGYIVSRGGFEGLYDSHRADVGDVHSADVGAFDPPIPVEDGDVAPDDTIEGV